jgi:hypothetical protein
METVINGPNLNRTFTMSRKAAKRTQPRYRAPSPQNLALPLPPPPQEEDIPASLEDPLPTTTDEAARKTALSDVSVGLPPPATDNDDANADTATDTQPNAGATRKLVASDGNMHDDESTLSEGRIGK